MLLRNTDTFAEYASISGSVFCGKVSVPPASPVASTANYKYVPMKGEFYPDYQKGGIDTVPPSLDRPVFWACATPLLVRQDELGSLVTNTR